MSADQPLPAPSLAEIERALDETLSVLIAYRRSPPDEVSRALKSKDREGFHPISIGTLGATDPQILRAINIVASPVERGLKDSLRELGKLVYAAVGADRMLEVAERVCGLDDANFSRRMSPINSAWNGIGHWVS